MKSENFQGVKNFADTCDFLKDFGKDFRLVVDKMSNPGFSFFCQTIVQYQFRLQTRLNNVPPFSALKLFSHPS